MLNEPVADAPSGGAAGPPILGLPGGQLPPFVGGPQVPDDGSYIQVTQEEKQAIDRVCLLMKLFVVHDCC